MPTIENFKNSGQTPSMLASLLVFGVMIGMILLSVWLFPGEVETGPLQISMTLATLLAVGVAYRYGFHGALVSEAITHSINAALGTIFILLAIGAVIGSLYLAGTVPAFVYYGVALLNPKIFYTAIFVLCSLLSILTGSSFSTAGSNFKAAPPTFQDFFCFSRTNSITHQRGLALRDGICDNGWFCWAFWTCVNASFGWFPRQI